MPNSSYFKSSSAEETKLFAKSFANNILNQKPALSATVIVLEGELGAGKTTFTQGFAENLGIKDRLISPTFVIVRRVEISVRGFKNFFHIDAYRIRSRAESESINLSGVFSAPENIVVVEWPQNIKSFLPKNALWIKFVHGKKENERKIMIIPQKP